MEPLVEETLGERVVRIVNMEPFFRDHGSQYFWEQTNEGVTTRFILWNTARVGPGDFQGFHGNVVFLGPTEIEPNTFNNLCQVKNINFGNFIFELGDEVCKNCASLESVVGKNILTIGKQAFFKCTSLKEVSFPRLSKADSWAFGHTAIEQVVFPLLQEIRPWMFEYCASLRLVSFPIAVTIGCEAFFGCTKLEVVILPSATSSNLRAFTDCKSLERLSLPLLKTAEQCSFNYCERLTTVSLPNLTAAGIGCFENCYNLQTISLPLLQEATDWLFQKSGLRDVHLPAVEKIASLSFNDCNNLKSIDVNPRATIQDNTLFNVPETVQITPKMAIRFLRQ